MEYVAQFREIQFDLKMAPGLGKMVGDGSNISKVLLNILSNACKVRIL